MAESSIVSLVRKSYEAFNSRDFEKSLALLDESAELINVAFQTTFQGKAGFRQFFQGWVDAFPDGKVEINRIEGGADFVVAEGVFSGTHEGILKGPAGSIEPTGRYQETPFCEVIYFRDGKLIKECTYFDSMTLLKQLDIAPFKAAA